MASRRKTDFDARIRLHEHHGVRSSSERRRFRRRKTGWKNCSPFEAVEEVGLHWTRRCLSFLQTLQWFLVCWGMLYSWSDKAFKLESQIWSSNLEAFHPPSTCKNFILPMVTETRHMVSFSFQTAPSLFQQNKTQPSKQPWSIEYGNRRNPRNLRKHHRNHKEEKKHTHHPFHGIFHAFPYLDR